MEQKSSKLILAEAKIKETEIESFLSLAATLVEKSSAEEGCISYKLYQDPFNKCSFSFVEMWKNQDAIDTHFEMPHFKLFGEKVESLLAEPLVISILNVH